METIILKIILCSGIILGLYYLFLAKEKTFIFNRFYLLLGLVFSYSIPFATIETRQIEDKKSTIIIEQDIPQQVLQNPTVTQSETFDYIQFLWIAYFIISGILILKVLYSIIKIKRLKGKKIIYQNRNVILLKKEIAPFSFLSTIYLSEKYFKDQKIDERIFLHEEIHVKQKHSFDVLLIEVVKAFSWFNPFIYFYKNAMITNHEFLADEEVISQKENIKNYQELILNEVLKQQNLPLTHRFNFNNTKKRFIMMTKRNSKFAEAKKYLAIPIFAVLAVLFAERVYANESTENLIKSNTISDDPYTEFKKILSKYSELLAKKQYAEFEKRISDEERLKLADLYGKLTDQQQNEQPILFLNLSDYKKVVPTEKQINDFSNLQDYLVVIDGKIVNNSELKKFKSSDFSYSSVNSSSDKPFNVTLMTNSYFKKYVEEKNPVMAFISSDITPPISRKSLINDTITPRKTNNAKVLKRNSTKDKDLSIPAPHPPSANFVQASFPEGMNVLRSKVAQNFNGSVFKGDEGTVKSAVYIVIDVNGNIDKVIATGDSKIFNNESERAVKSVVANTKWKPATDNGKPVKTTFSLPLTMTFESAKKTQ
ncbi:M56 family metallopeptidase [Chryseobacterium sp. PBS4-4]|uniref:M56 family metallopeptidase n=1 Tax=Chryseobacterium edaphi TaxID=2976532 RepID=A0ABT2W7K8_9FLAO|nr:M56 family metallopeptidase [Chryseobacterium edaphi]MCU7617389.1 M56 family metallopeptidase [Chryseobacterium edaphi]